MDSLPARICASRMDFVDSSENIYIADTANSAIREVAPSGTITAVAGTLGSFGYTPAAGLATSALINYPASVAVDSTGDIFIADSDNYVVREVTAEHSDHCWKQHAGLLRQRRTRDRRGT